MKSGKTIKSLAFIVCFLVSACGHQSRVPPAPPPIVATPPVPSSADCRLISEPGEPIRAVALGEPVNPANAPYPSNDSERLLFRQLYETLVRVDCQGKVRPGLAVSWQMDANKRAWIVALRENARFSDGRAVTAAAVVAGWTIGSELRPEVRRLVRSIVAVDDRTLEITLFSQGEDAPLALAHTDLAIVRRGTGSLWPLGTRGTSIAPERETPTGLSVLALIRLGADPTPIVRFLLAPGRDARDLLDDPVDFLLTRDPKVLDYTARLAPFASVPLAWQRTHVLLIPGRARTARALSAEEREALAHDAVRGEARAAAGPFWWQSLAECGIAASQQQAPLPSMGRLVYDESDGTARDLADRLVSLARVSGPGTAGILDAILPVGRTYQRATGLTGEELASAYRRGNDAGYIVAFDARPLDPCREMRATIDNA